LLVFRPEQTFTLGAANGGFEPIVKDAATVMNGGFGQNG